MPGGESSQSQPCPPSRWDGAFYALTWAAISVSGATLKVSWSEEQMLWLPCLGPGSITPGQWGPSPHGMNGRSMQGHSVLPSQTSPAARPLAPNCLVGSQLKSCGSVCLRASVPFNCRGVIRHPLSCHIHPLLPPRALRFGNLPDLGSNPCSAGSSSVTWMRCPASVVFVSLSAK